MLKIRQDNLSRGFLSWPAVLEVAHFPILKLVTIYADPAYWRKSTMDDGDAYLGQSYIFVGIVNNSQSQTTGDRNVRIFAYAKKPPI